MGERSPWRTALTASAAAVGVGLVALLPGADAVGTTPRTSLAGSAAVAGPFVGPRISQVVPQTVPTAQTTVLLGEVSPVVTAPVDASFTGDLPDGRAGVAVRTAMAQIGLPYVWGGDGPTAGDAGFDCSGLTTFAYAAAGLALPRTAHTQYYAGPHVPAGAPLQPGDLVFYGTSARVHHVGMYLGGGRMVNAPTFGKPVQVAYYRWTGDDYLGATRPAALVTGTGMLPFVPPVAGATPPPVVFQAPAAPLPAVVPDATVPQPPEAQTAAESVAESDRAVAAGEVPAPAPTTPDQPMVNGSEAPARVSTVPAIDVPAGNTPADTVPVTTVPVSTVPETTVPVTIGPTTPRPTTPPPTTTEVAPTTTAPPTSSSSATPAPVVPDAVTIGGRTSPLEPGRRGANGLPAAGGVVGGAGARVVRVAALAADAGDRVTLTLSDGSTTTYTVRSSETLDTDVAAATRGALVLVAPAGASRWTVVVAS